MFGLFKYFVTFCAQFDEVKELSNEGIPQQPLMAFAGLFVHNKLERLSLTGLYSLV
jgi:hypothetical protein